jgi:hypothetical protein
MKAADFFRSMWRRCLSLSALVAVSAAAAACIGTIGDGGDSNGPGAGNGNGGPTGTTSSPLCGAPSPGAAPLRRLTQSEYNNTVRDLLGDSSNPANAFPPDQKIGDFTNTAVALTVPPLLAQAYQSAAEQLAATAVGNMSKLLPCDPATTGQDACAQKFVTSFGTRAFRRPVTSDEQTALFALYQSNVAGATFANGIQAVVEAVLQSASFLYRVEFGDTAHAQGKVVPLTSYEMASRLSYFLWDSMPDDALFAAAGAGQLTTAAQIQAQATRMLQDPKAQPAVEQFYSQWLTLDQVATSAKDPTTYPEYTPALQSAMQKETLAFVDWVMWQSDAKLSTLLTAPVSFLNQDLAALYGVSGVSGSALKQVSLDPTQRAGLMTQPSLMTILGKPDRSSPVRRGKFVRERLLCQTILPPPSNIVITPPPVQPGVTTRQMFEGHDKVEPCKDCHLLMDPIGFGFEHFDGVGKWRTTDQGQPVDSSSTLAGTDVDGTFDGAVTLAHKLAQSHEVSDCMVKEWFRYTFGRGESPDDACSLDTLKKEFVASGFDVRKLLAAITQTDAFRYRPEVTP